MRLSCADTGTLAIIILSLSPFSLAFRALPRTLARSPLSLRSSAFRHFSPPIPRTRLPAMPAIADSEASASGPTPTPTPVYVDRARFQQTVRLAALRVPARSCAAYLSRFSGSLFQRPRMKKIYPNEDPLHPDTRLVLLAHMDELDCNLLEPGLRAYNEEVGGVLQWFDLHLGYEHFPADEVLRSLLPSLLEVPSSFEQAGHIAHLNLREEALPHKSLIAQVLLDKNPTLRSVVNKVGNIDTEYRTFPMELLAGDADMEVTLKESGARFTFNFAQVYWNSRLQMEHSRLILDIQARVTAAGAIKPTPIMGAGSIKPMIVADMMAGVGPFAVPLTMAPKMPQSKKKGKEGKEGNEEKPLKRADIICYANDLNPASYKYLLQNSRNNHCQNLTSYNMCGRDFILKLVDQGVEFHEVIMNLPQSATDFLDVFVGLNVRRRQRDVVFSGGSGAGAGVGAGGGGGVGVGASGVAGVGAGVGVTYLLPRINVYAFSTASDPIDDIISRCAGVMGCPASAVRYGRSAGEGAGKGVSGGIAGEAGNSLVSGELSRVSGESRNGPLLPGHHCSGHIVRDVSPKKVMVCLSFTLPLEVAEARPIDLVPYSPASAPAPDAAVPFVVVGFKRAGGDADGLDAGKVARI